jgi:hypothetical protein
MKEEQLIDTLRTLARHVVRNELVCEYFLESQGVSRETLWTKALGIDQHLKDNTDWQNRFPGLFD